LICLGLALFAGANPEPQSSTQADATPQPSAAKTDAPAAKPAPAPMPAAPAASPQPSSGKAADVKSTNPSAPFESGTVINVTTRLVTIDVVATDGKGHAITDLEAKDFTILEDGKPQKVRAFGFQHPREPDPKLEIPKLPPNVFTNIPQFVTNSALNVILVDTLNTSLPDQSYARSQVLHYLDKLPPNEPTAVYVLTDDLKLVHDFSTDAESLKQAVKSTNIKFSVLLDNPLEASTGHADAAMRQTRRRMRIDETMLALESLARSLAGFEGRKNLFWVSEGFPLSINPDATLDPDAEADFDQVENNSTKVAKAAEVLTDAQVAIYPIDARGLAPYTAFSAATPTTGNLRNGAEFGRSLMRESQHFTASHDTMNLLAESTGGKAYYNRNDIDGAIRDGMNDGSTYYLLGYYPDNKTWDGKFRKLQIKVARDGAKLRYRLGYYAADPAAITGKNAKQRERDLGSALMLDRPLLTGIFFEAGVLQPSEKSQNKVTVNYAVDPHTVKIDPGADGLQHAELDCVVQAFSEKGKPVNSIITSEEFSLKPDTYQRVLKSGFRCQNQIDLPPGKYQLRFAIRDNRSGVIGTSSGEVTVTAAVAENKETKKTQ
jgi:VWFA-related protein